MSLPPFDGTGWIVGMPGLPGGAPAVISVAPGSTQTVAHDAPGVTAAPLTAWTTGQVATFTDGAFHWSGSAWVAGPAVLDEESLTGWTVAELKAFAADHEPPIEVPSSANKAQIIELILAALATDPEEN